jgi:hypothetical protein
MESEISCVLALSRMSVSKIAFYSKLIQDQKNVEGDK